MEKDACEHERSERGDRASSLLIGGRKHASGLVAAGHAATLIPPSRVICATSPA